MHNPRTSLTANLITTGLGYCCEAWFLAHFASLPTETIAARLGVHPATVRARRALFAHLEDYEKSTCFELELDPIAVCCDFAEYPSALSAAEAYGFKDGIDSKEESALEWLQNRTQTIEFDGGIVIQLF